MEDDTQNTYDSINYNLQLVLHQQDYQEHANQYMNVNR